VAGAMRAPNDARASVFAHSRESRVALIRNFQTVSRNCLKSLGDARIVALEGTEGAPFGPFRLRDTGQIHARSLARTLFRQFLERLSGNSGQSPFHGPLSLHDGRKGTLFGAARYRQTRDPTRPATFQTVSRRRILGSPRLRTAPLAAPPQDPRIVSGPTDRT
jgi:hypothetical protein